MILLASGGANGGGYLASKYVLIAMHGGILFLHALINSLNITWLSYITIIAAAWNVVGKCSNSNTCIHPTPPTPTYAGPERECCTYSWDIQHIVDYYWNIPNVYSRLISNTLCLCNFFMDLSPLDFIPPCNLLAFFFNILQSITSPHGNFLFDLLMISTTYYKNQYFNKNVNMK